ncbi:hypothetical protein BHE74_00056190, partial [Ensete ventricosum]
RKRGRGLQLLLLHLCFLQRKQRRCGELGKRMEEEKKGKKGEERKRGGCGRGRRRGKEEEEEK